MTTPMDERAAATRMNQSLAERIGRWKRVRLAAMLLSLVAGSIAIAADLAFLSVPCFLLAILAGLFYIDARDQQKHVAGRRWNSITPHTSRIFRDADDGGTQPQHSVVKQ